MAFNRVPPVMLRPLGLVGVCLGFACSDSSPNQAPEPAVWVDVGLTGGADGLEFVPLDAGGAVPLHTFGQGGTHAILAVRCSGLGARAFVGVTITNVETGDEVVAPPSDSPRLLLCRDEEVCDLLPLLVMTGGLVPPGSEREGLPVQVRVDASNLAGVSASVERNAVLSTADL
jgi:hypothetical protein